MNNEKKASLVPSAIKTQSFTEIFFISYTLVFSIIGFVLLFFTDKIGYPQFYTQLLFEKNNPIIRIKTVINNEEGLRKVSTCDKVEVFQNKS